MRRPAPPPLAELDFAWNIGELDKLRTTPYWHWDELRFRSPPTGLDAVTWWKQLKLIRKLAYVYLPLEDERNRPFCFGVPSDLQRKLHELDRVMSGQIPPPAEVRGSARDRYLLSSLREEAITSSQLEGASTTRAVAVEMLRTARPPRTADERMIANNYVAMQWLRERRAAPLTPQLVIELQGILTKDAIDPPDGSGRLRRDSERVVVESDQEVVHVPPPAAELEDRMRRMCAFANATGDNQVFVHPILRAIALHFWLAFDHPFVDGNGRTARALFYWSMLGAGYWLTEFITISKVIREAPAQYARAFLFVETDDNDMTYFFLQQIDVLEKSVAALVAYLASKRAEESDVSTLLPHADLNHRQRAVLAHALRNPAQEYTVARHQHQHEIVYDTARLDLLDLAKRGYLSKHKRGREFYFVAATKLRKLATRKS